MSNAALVEALFFTALENQATCNNQPDAFAAGPSWDGTRPTARLLELAFVATTDRTAAVSHLGG
jgi:hypothetical protein